MPETSTIKKILVIRFSAIGDIVLTTPVVRCLKKQTGAEIHFLTKKKFEGLVRSNPYVDRVFGIGKKVSEVVSDLKSMNYTHVIDLHGNLRSWQVKRALKAQSFTFHKLNAAKWLLVNLKINQMPALHIVDRYLAAAAALGVVNDGAGLDYFVPEKDVVDTAIFLPEKKFVAFVIGAAHATKRLPNEKIVAICDKIPYPILLLGGKEDVLNADAITSQSKSYVINLAGKLNLNQSASVVAQAAVVITHDTGLMHIAAAFQSKIISIWGNTVPSFGMTAYTADAEIVEVKDLSCRPCSKIGYEKCPRGHFKCMNNIDSATVAHLVEEKMGKNTEGG